MISKLPAICVLTTSTTVHQMGGTEVHAETLAKAAAGKGHTVTLVTTAHPLGLGSETKDGYETIYIPGTNFSMSRNWLSAWWLKSAAKLMELGNKGLIDVVWSENCTGQYYAGLAGPGKKPLISILNGPPVLGELQNHWAQVNSPAALGYFLGHSVPQIMFYTLPWLRKMAERADFLVAVSEYCEEEMKKEFSACRGKIKTIYNPVDTALFRPDSEARRAARQRYGLEPLAPVLAMSGVLQKQKGMAVGLKAFRLIKTSRPDTKLLIAGDGPELENLKRQAAALGLGQAVIFCGRIENSAMNLFYNAADIYINPTLRHEGLAIVILEAMACGLPGVISKIGGTASTIDDGQCGFFVKPGKHAEIAAKTLLLLEDENLRKTMGGNARKKVLEFFRLDEIIRQYLDISLTLTRGTNA